MRVMRGNLWDIPADFRGIPTNGEVDRYGCAVMGAGVALQAKHMYPGVDLELGRLLQRNNRLYFLPHNLFSFPTKHSWRGHADIDLIRQSVVALIEAAEQFPDKTFAIPLVGTGLGGLSTEAVWPLLQYLPDNVIVVVLEETKA